MAFLGGQVVACLGWGAPVWRVTCRDHFISSRELDLCGYKPKVSLEKDVSPIIKDTYLYPLTWKHQSIPGKINTSIEKLLASNTIRS
jgi:hypothetical protein